MNDALNGNVLNNGICPFCHSNSLKEKKVFQGSILICQRCLLGINFITSPYDYEHNTDFSITESILTKWDGYAKVQASLIANNLKLDNKPLSVLEIGSGFGFVSTYLNQHMNIKHYFDLEKNQNLCNFLKENKHTTISNIQELKDQTIDLIIMNHVLEHIEAAYSFLLDLLKDFPTADIVLLQTNHKGFIPTYLPYLWYGWQLNQHYYHFTPQVFKTMEQEGIIIIKTIEYYKLPQEASFNFKGIIKLFLKLLNMMIKKNASDAFLIIFQSNISQKNNCNIAGENANSFLRKV